MTIPDDHAHEVGPRFPADRSERAKAMVAAGLFGGAGRGQGRKPRPRSAGEGVAELAAQEVPAIKRAYSDGLRSKNERTRIHAADKLLATERAERGRRSDDDDWLSYDWDQLSGAELDAARTDVLERAYARDPAMTLALMRCMLATSTTQSVAVIDSVAIESSA